MEHPVSWALWPNRRAFALGSLLCFSAFIGCGGPATDRVPVAGEVTLDGQPLERGSIEFHPEGEEGTVTGGVIREGTFEIPAVQGAKPGNYSVRIFASGSGVEVDPDQPPGPEAEGQVAEELIPAKFNTETELSEEIGEQGAVDLRFELTSS